MDKIVTPSPVVKQKNPILAAVASFFIPGLGQVYNGEGLVKGILFLAGTFIGCVIFVIPGIAVWLYGIYNAYSVAKKMNEGLIAYKEATGMSLIIHIVIYVIAVVIAVVLLSLIIALFVFSLGSSLGGSSYSGYGY